MRNRIFGFLPVAGFRRKRQYSMGKQRFEKLLEPFCIGRVKTRNRIVKTASGAFFIEPTGHLGERATAYYETIAKGGVGLLIVESCGVEYPLGIQHPIQFHLDDDKYIPSYRKLTQAVHKHGCPIFLQFQHAGPWNPTGRLPERDTRAASTLAKSELPGPDFDVPRGLSLAEVKEYVDIWAKASERAQKAGFDGVEVNGATCHQINTFFSRIWNKRDDEYGCASLENRARFMCDIVGEIRKRTGPDFAVTVLINIAEYGHEKATTIAEGVGFARLLQDAGADAVQVRAHAYGNRSGLIQPDRFCYPEPSKSLPKDLDWSRRGTGALVPLTEAVKKVVSVPVFCACRLEPVLGEKLLHEGKVDFVGMTRRLLADPELPNKVAAGKLEDIRPCSGCLYCRSFILKDEPARCRVNAELGREYEHRVMPAKKQKNVMVIGGGPAGLEAARVAALRGHKVALFERSHRLGGLVPMAALVNDSELDDLLALVRYLALQLTKLGVTIRLGKEINASVVEEFKPDVVILAAGGVPGVLEIPGVNEHNVITSSALHRRLNIFQRLLGPKTLEWLTRLWMPIGKRVIVIGGAIQGCELAEFLVKRHRKVIIVEAGDTLGEGMTVDNQRRLVGWLNEKGVTMFTGVKHEEITSKGLVITSKEGKQTTIESDTTVLILPLKPNTDFIKSLEKVAPEIYPIGDCREPHLIAEAIADGWQIACKI
jgi:2,4-dienoyl-CoA reductase (NADPH2)